MGIRPYAADCGALVLPLASKVKLRTPSNGSEQFCMIAVCSLCCRLTVYNFQHIRLRSLDRLGMTEDCFRTRRKVSECPPPQEIPAAAGCFAACICEYKKKTPCNFVSAVLYCPCRVRQGRFFCRLLVPARHERGKSRFLLKERQSAPRGGRLLRGMSVCLRKMPCVFRAGVLY